MDMDCLFIRTSTTTSQYLVHLQPKFKTLLVQCQECDRAKLARWVTEIDEMYGLERCRTFSLERNADDGNLRPFREGLHFAILNLGNSQIAIIVGFLLVNCYRRY